MRDLGLAVACLSVVLPTVSSARPYPTADVPPDLAPWVPWVLDAAPDRACVKAGDKPVCVWPSRLALDLSEAGGSFSLDVATDREAVVGLPGGPGAWPQAVAAGAAAVAVLERDGRPYAVLPAGSWRVSGRFAWASLPESIPVPPDCGRTDLVVDGKAVPFPRRDEGGLLWLRARAEAGEEGDRLDLEVYRKVADGVPAVVTTRVVLRASGRPREVDLGPVLLAGTVPIAVQAEVPARIDDAGSLRVQVRAGTWNVEVTARTEGGAPETLAAPKRNAPWPGTEAWVFQADDALRQVTVSGAPGVDPSRTGLREDWRGLPAWLVEGGKALSFATARRGEPEPPPSSLTLERDVWLDVDGGGWTIRDRVRGRLTKGWRVDLAPPAVLGHASVDRQDQLVTTDPATGLPGVEVRRGDVDLVAESRIDGGSRTLPAVGWTEDVHSLAARLHLAPGWTLLAASGVDRVPGTWVDRWTLLSFLFVLLVSLAVARLTRWYFGLLALAALVLDQHQSGSPYWVWVALLAAVALLRVVPEGRFRTFCRVGWLGSVVALVAVLAPFAIREVRSGLYPQTGRGSGGDDWGMMLGAAAPERDVVDLTTANAPAAAPTGGARNEAEKSAEQIDRDGYVQEEGRSGLVLRSYQKASKASWKQNLQYDPNAVVQTGPGLPEWSWTTVRMDWNGPVDRDHRVRLWLASPAANLALSIARVLLTVGLALVLLVAGRRGGRAGAAPAGTDVGSTGTGAGVGAVAGAIALALSLAVSIGSPSAASAAVPPREVLDDLRERLTRPEPCEPQCLSTARIAIAVRDGTLSLRASVHAGAPGAWPVPGPARSWVPASVTVDGAADVPLALLDNGFLHVRVGPGAHEVAATGPLPDADAVTIELGGAPQRVEADAPGWEVEGLREDGRAERSIRLVRRVEAASRREAETGALPAWLLVTRTLDVGIPWLVHTTVHRASPTGSPVVVRVPLLPGESVTDSDLRVEGRDVVVSLGRDDADVGWESTLDEQESLALVAPQRVPWTETWVLRCSPVWECAADGLPPVRHQQDGRWEPLFRPYPGETLKLSFKRPAGAAGQSVTIDRAELAFAPGTRISSGTLRATVRSSQGGPLAFELPAGAKVQKVAVDDRDDPIREEAGRVSVTLRPGSQRIEIDWQQPGGIALLQRVPAVGLGAAAANARVVVTLPEGRWLIAVGGPRWGPAVLFWGLLIGAILAAVLLGRIPWTPLPTWQWVLLAAGLTLVPIQAGIAVAGWLLAMQWRGTHAPPARPVLHDGLQLLLAGWTVVAMGCLYGAVHTGLLLHPDMQVAGAGSHDGRLVWIADRVGAALPTPWVLSLPRLAWQAVTLAWSLWLAWSLVRWLPWAWRCFSSGSLWTPLRKAKRALGITPPVPPARPAAPAPDPPPPAGPAAAT